MDFPLDMLVPWQRLIVKAVSKHTQTDEAMAAMFCLGFTSAAVARRAVVVTESGRRCPLNLWVLVIAGSGEDKSTPFDILSEPLDLAQRTFEMGEVAALARASTANSVSRPRTHWERLRANDLFGSSAPTASVLSAASWVHLGDVMAELSRAQENSHPGIAVDFLVADATPASLIEMMSGQLQGVVQAAPEAGFSSWIAGGASRALGQIQNLNIAWDGRHIRRSRVARPTPPLLHASLTLVCAPQPEAFQELSRQRLLRRSGYLPRFLLCFPKSRQGYKSSTFPGLEREVVQAYSRHIWALMSLPVTPGQPMELHMNPDGIRVLGNFFDEIEPRLRPNGDLAQIADWVQKLRLNAIRLAGVLHLARHAAGIPAGRHRGPIDGETTTAAVAIARWMLPHGQQAFGEGSVSRLNLILREDDLVLDVLRNRERFRHRSFTVREVHRAAQTRFESAEQVQRGLDVLVARGVLSKQEAGRRVGYSIAPTPSDNDT